MLKKVYGSAVFGVEAHTITIEVNVDKGITEAATDITETSATLNGVISIISENCDVPNNTEQGFVYSTEIQPTLEDIQVNVNGTNIATTIESLEPNTTYYVRAFLTNNFGDFYGDEISFSTTDIPWSFVGIIK